VIVQQHGVTLAASEPVVLELTTKASHTQLRAVSIYGIAPSHYLHELEAFGIALYANAGASSVDGFQVRVAYDPAVLSFEGFQVSSNFVYAASFKHVARWSLPFCSFAPNAVHLSHATELDRQAN
jgi:hypothetical protein